jgi:hypothetical protein
LIISSCVNSVGLHLFGLLYPDGYHFTEYERTPINNDNVVEFKESFEAFFLQTNGEDICMWEPVSVILSLIHVVNGGIQKVK